VVGGELQERARRGMGGGRVVVLGLELIYDARRRAQRRLTSSGPDVLAVDREHDQPAGRLVLVGAVVRWARAVREGLAAIRQRHEVRRHYGARPAIDLDLEVGGAQTFNRTAVIVDDGGVDGDEVYTGTKNRRLRGARRLLAAGGQRQESEQRGESSARGPHRAAIVQHRAARCVRFTSGFVRANPPG
jgi:hypothetical protein